MSKKTLNVSVLILSALFIIASMLGFYSVELERTRSVSENQSYIYCAERTLSLAGAAGKAGEKPASNAADTSKMPKMQAELTWLAEYNSTLGRLDRAYDELCASPVVDGTASYAEACLAVASYHQSQLDDVNARANMLNAVCAALLILGISGAAWSALRLTKER